MELEDLYRQSDVVSLHVRLTPETTGMVGRQQLAAMKPTAILVNTARGAVVDEAALVEALRGETIRGAGLDVFEQEPMPENHQLAQTFRTWCSRRIQGGVTAEALETGLRLAVDNVFAAMRGQADESRGLTPPLACSGPSRARLGSCPSATEAAARDLPVQARSRLGHVHAYSNSVACPLRNR